MWSYANSVRGTSSSPARRCASRPARRSPSCCTTRCPRRRRSCSPGRRACRPTATRPSRSSTPAARSPRWCSPPQPATGSVTYTFTAGRPGTYLYESGTDVSKQIQMGLYGALVVRPAGHPDQVNDRSRLGVQPGPRVPLPALRGRPRRSTSRWSAADPIDWKTFKARYFMINGRSMPDTLAPNNASWLPNQPYGALVHIRALRRGHQPAAGDHPLPQRRAPSTTRSTRTAATSGWSTRTASRCRARADRTCRT